VWKSMHIPSTDSLAASLGISTSCHAATGHLCTQLPGNRLTAKKSSGVNAGITPFPRVFFPRDVKSCLCGMP